MQARAHIFLRTRTFFLFCQPIMEWWIFGLKRGFVLVLGYFSGTCQNFNLLPKMDRYWTDDGSRMIWLFLPQFRCHSVPLLHFLSGKGECLAAADNEQLSVLEGFDRRCRFLSGNHLNALRHIGEGTGNIVVSLGAGQL